MAIESNCSGCGQKLAVDESHAGKRARCPSCGQIYTVPYASGSQHPSLGGGQAAAGNNDDIFRQQNVDESFRDPALAETSEGTGSTAPDIFSGTGANVEPDQPFWMKTGEGAEYGPVDRATLNRWFNEGRVGPSYQIKQGETGVWQSAEIFRPNSGNPFAAQPGTAQPGPARPTNYGVGQSGKQYQKPDPSGLVLTMGILSWVSLLICGLLCPIFGVIAWSYGRTALNDIQSGIADPVNLSLVQVGYYLGLAMCILTMVGLIGLVGIFAVALVAGA